MKAIIYKDKAGKWRWHIKARNGRIIADSGQGYKKESDCYKGLELVWSWARNTIGEAQNYIEKEMLNG